MAPKNNVVAELKGQGLTKDQARAKMLATYTKSRVTQLLQRDWAEDVPIRQLSDTEEYATALAAERDLEPLSDFSSEVIDNKKKKRNKKRKLSSSSSDDGNNNDTQRKKKTKRLEVPSDENTKALAFVAFRISDVQRFVAEVTTKQQEIGHLDGGTFAKEDIERLLAQVPLAVMLYFKTLSSDLAKMRAVIGNHIESALARRITNKLGMLGNEIENWYNEQQNSAAGAPTASSIE